MLGWITLTSCPSLQRLTEASSRAQQGAGKDVLQGTEHSLCVGGSGGRGVHLELRDRHSTTGIKGEMNMFSDEHNQSFSINDVSLQKILK